MVIKYNNTEIEFNIPDVEYQNFDIKANIIVLALSGGTDSAALFYLICKHWSSVEIIPYCCEEAYNPYDIQAAEKIVEFMRNKFPNNNIRDLVKGKYDESLDYRNLEGLKLELDLNTGAVSKTVQLDIVKDRLLKENANSVFFQGMTKNPPISVQEQYPLMKENAEVRRNVDTFSTQYGHRNYRPFINVDKKFVADIFRVENLMDTLFPLTRSCVGNAWTTNLCTKECHRCFWCYEKKWAFNLEWDYNLVGPDVNGPNDIHVEASEVERYLDENKP